jgi:hypothetical protein
MENVMPEEKEKDGLRDVATWLGRRRRRIANAYDVVIQDLRAAALARDFAREPVAATVPEAGAGVEPITSNA